MAATANPAALHPTSAVSATRPAGVPWYVILGVLALTSANIGGAWDVSWHRSIGRDTFWTPAHIAIYACGVLAGIICAYLILSTTFNRNSPLRPSSVSVFGLRAPFGAFLAAWGGLAMLTSAPFDNWWHAAYGLDVKIVSPPHTLLILGIRAVGLGILFLTLAAMNRAADPNLAGTDTADRRTFRRLQFLFLYIGGLSICGQMFFLQEYTFDIKLHQASAYIATAIAVPIVLALFAQASRSRWAATTCTSIYMLFLIAEILVFPLFPAQPKLGPVFNPVTHLIPAKFPVFLILPALGLDLLWQRTRAWRPWQIALASGILFVAILTAVEWPFANFLLSHSSQSRFFGTIYFDYNSRPDGPDRLRQFFNPDQGLTLTLGLLRATLYATLSTWTGLRLGHWMRTVER